ncbi:MAG: type III-B CRISPR module-associated protein Cmr3 [Propionibacteriaceae bacterium]|nr:type III-B CRISPR module-associated protein Cmr3 [Propionibacteriaceae bacterium]
MSRFILRIDALTPLLFRDARPFTGATDATRARSLDFPGPSTIAGFVRTHVGDSLHWQWTPEQADAARKIRCVASWMVMERGGRIDPVLPAPATAVPYSPETRTDGQGDSPGLMRLLPLTGEHDGHCPMPDGLVPLSAEHGVKPLPGYEYWTWEDTTAWLAGATSFPAQVSPPPTDERIQIGLDPATHAVREGHLFAVEYRDWESGSHSPTHDGGDGRASAQPEHTRWAQYVAIDVPQSVPGYDEITPETLSTVGHFGGERRPVSVTASWADTTAPGLDADADLAATLTSTTRVTLQLATPGLFSRGWKPGWIGDDQSPTLIADPPPQLSALRGARLISAAVNRHETVAGWDYDSRRRGPKATRWAAPAGSTYFLELATKFTRDDITNLWLVPTSDNEQDRADGYGLAVWGVWGQERYSHENR